MSSLSQNNHASFSLGLKAGRNPVKIQEIMYIPKEYFVVFKKDWIDGGIR